MSFLGGQYSSRNIGCSCIICNSANNQCIVVSVLLVSVVGIRLYWSVLYIASIGVSVYCGKFHGLVSRENKGSDKHKLVSGSTRKWNRQLPSMNRMSFYRW